MAKLAAFTDDTARRDGRLGDGLSLAASLVWLLQAAVIATVLAGLLTGERMLSPLLAAALYFGLAVLRGGVGYLTAIVDVPFDWALVGLAIALTLIALVGVLESLAFAAVLTVIEVCGLLLVIWAGFGADPVPDWSLPLPDIEWNGLAIATLFAFFAFIGFDDMVNMAEETRAPERTMPRAILLALGITAVLYALVSLAAVRAVPREALAGSERPLALVWEAGTGTSPVFLSAIAVAAALNGVLAQIVMAARVLYGLAKRSPALLAFRRTSRRFGTPVLGTLVVAAAMIASAFTLPVATLAELTTLALLVVFTVVNAALIGVKRKRPEAPFRVPVWVPWLGAAASAATLAASLKASAG